MFELTIKGTVYQFAFNMGFLRRINKTMGMPVDGVPNAKKNVGLQYLVAGVMDGELESLVDILYAANEKQEPRVTTALLDDYIDECEDIEGLFKTVLDFLEQSNATKSAVLKLKEALEEEKAKRAAQ